jgi:hypothetical protein
MKQIRIATYISIALHFIRRMFRKVSAARIKSRKLSTVKGRMPTNLERFFGYRSKDIDWNEFYGKTVMFYRFGNIVNAGEIYTKSYEDMDKVACLLEKMYPDHKQAIYRYPAWYDLQNTYKKGLLVPNDKHFRTILKPGFYPETTDILMEIDDKLPGSTVELKELTVCRLSDTTSH